MAHNSYPIMHESMEDPSVIVLTGLQGSYDMWRKLSPQSGTTVVNTNQHGELAMRADRESEDEMLDAVVSSGIPTFVSSEEHGFMAVNYDPNTSQEALRTAIIDGIDGSSVMVKNWQDGDYGAIFTLAESGNPAYGDWLATGITHFTSGKIYSATQGQTGVLTRDANNQEPDKLLFTDQAATLTPQSVIHAEIAEVSPDNPLHEYFKLGSELGNTLKDAGYNTSRSASTAGNIIGIIEGTVAADLAATRKGNLELIAERALVQAAGGVMYALERDDQGMWVFVDLGAEQFFAYGQKEHIPVLAAANQAIADEILAVLNRAL